MRLTIELVPSTVWNSSLYQLLPRNIWNKIRNEHIAKHGRKCQICGETRGVMNLHEIWNYDDINHIQKLDGFILLCKMCHHVKHIGLAGILASQGKLDYNKVIEHFCKVNTCNQQEFEKHQEESFEKWSIRSCCEWEQDFGKYREFIKQ